MSLHRQLKSLYGGNERTRQEVQVDGYRIDAIERKTGRLIEIQSASLTALRDKTRQLLAANYKVLIVKPLVARKMLITHNRPGGEILTSRKSPLRQTWYDVFVELVHFVGIFPHPGLTLEVLLTAQEEHRVPSLRKRRRGLKYRVEDRLLLSIEDRLKLRTAKDLRKLLPPDLTTPFSTAELAQAANIPRWLAQKMTYCLRKIGALKIAGKQGNSVLYEQPTRIPFNQSRTKFPPLVTASHR